MPESITQESPPSVEARPEEAVLAKLRADIEGCLRMAAENYMKSTAKDQTVSTIRLSDGQQSFEYQVGPKKAQEIEQALWTAGEDLTDERIREYCLQQVQKRKFNLQTTVVEVH